jgi:hypothetical protein
MASRPLVAFGDMTYELEYLFSCRARTSGGEYSITDDGRVRPKHVLMEFRK